MSNCYKYLPTNRSRRSGFYLKKRQTKRYLFMLLLFVSLMFMILYEFYFTIAERAKNGESEAGIFESILCQVFMLTVCPKKDNSSVIQLRNKVEDINKAQTIRNSDRFEITEETIVFVIQVHKRSAHLRGLIESLHSVVGINSSLLIFSHDYFDEEINEVVNSVDFAPVMQIFLPFSIQLYPAEFPGFSPNDCPWDVGVQKAKQLDCQGAQTPDHYGHYRQGEVTQIKHHWWWKINRVFDHLKVTKNFDDYYVAPDILHTLHLMIDFSVDNCTECNSFHLGTFTKTLSYEEEANKVDIGQWNNLGFSFNRTFWNVLRECASVFCTFDDYNWDWSYQYAAQQCFFQKLTPLVVRASRVFHVGDCDGMHNQRDDCNFETSLQSAKDLVESEKRYFFPESLIILGRNYHQARVQKGWGGWSDPRDIQLCLDITSLDTS
ncbi:alpha-1,6-mannosyl-glycoprotein 2-beta-N-acetylglucosaminyltransferase-like isoform X2 [Homalodisca vitripennis]|uniref:alpha-1,6-mannosyl-glycoprotein 2-beta-N-acetylglucosaminyltransferase-like isoform X2 n=1 Tax=Homalodisca vitripennis TaxID=197043 RepID=UPI001EECE1F3|nr:alpha-1,6-mannosyl-glycoprotein 2-beta-N-acetylglucosaminyltransferase-like isoform X2 [Homalodisca vitripennis]